MKKLAVLGMGVCIVLAFSSCKSSESAYKKAYEKAKQQELAEPQTTAPVEEVAPVVSAPVEAKVVESAPVGTIREEKVTVVIRCPTVQRLYRPKRKLNADRLPSPPWMHSAKRIRQVTKQVPQQLARHWTKT